MYPEEYEEPSGLINWKVDSSYTGARRPLTTNWGKRPNGSLWLKLDTPNNKHYYADWQFGEDNLRLFVEALHAHQSK